MNTICNDNDDRKVSIARDLDYGLAHNGAHMIAHA